MSEDLKKLVSKLKNSNKLTQLELEEIYNEEMSIIEGSKAFNRLGEKTQVMGPAVGRPDIINDRKSHTYHVITSCKQAATSIAKKLGLNSMFDIDYNYSLQQIAKAHDLGHSPFGHDGAGKADLVVKARGLLEGFSDNNNNLVIIEAQKMKLRDCILAGLIKYPDDLYDYQKEKYLPLLAKQIEEDRIYFEKNLGIKLNPQKKTINCQIMDEADRNTYTCDDMADYFCLENTIELKDALNFIDENNKLNVILINEMVNVANSKSKTKIRSFFDKLKKEFNQSLDFTEDGIIFANNDLLQFREALSKMTFELYIKPIRKDSFHLDNMKEWEIFLNHCLDGEYTESNYYNEELKKAIEDKDEIKILRLKRDAACEISDTYLNNYIKKIYTKDVSNLLKNTNKLKL